MSLTWSLNGNLAKEVKFLVHLTAMNKSLAEISWLFSDMTWLTLPATAALAAAAAAAAAAATVLALLGQAPGLLEPLDEVAKSEDVGGPSPLSSKLSNSFLLLAKNKASK